MVPETLIHIVEVKADFSIIEILNNRRRTWVARAVGGKAEEAIGMKAIKRYGFIGRVMSRMEGL